MADTSDTSDIYIASCVVRVRPEHLAARTTAIEQVIRAPVAGSDAKGRLVVVLEGDSTAALLDQMEQIRNMEGVLSIEMVYQHAEDESLMEELLT